MHESEKWKGSRTVMSDSSRPHGLQPTRLLYPWDFPGNSTAVGCHCLLCLAVLGTLKSLLQHHSSKASILRCSAFSIVQLSHPYMTTGKSIAFTRQNFVDKVMSLLFNMLSRLVITFLPRSKCLLISWLQSPSAVILQPKKVKLATVSTVSPSICHKVIGLDTLILVFWMLSCIQLHLKSVYSS